MLNYVFLNAKKNENNHRQFNLFAWKLKIFKLFSCFYPLILKLFEVKELFHISLKYMGNQVSLIIAEMSKFWGFVLLILRDSASETRINNYREKA